MSMWSMSGIGEVVLIEECAKAEGEDGDRRVFSWLRKLVLSLQA